MLSKEVIIKKIDDLHNTIEGIKAEKDTISNELKVVLAGSELQLIMLQSSMGQSEESLRKLVEKFEERAKELNEKYAIASANQEVMEKSQLHAMIWTNDIRLDTLKWILEDTEEIM